MVAYALVFGSLIGLNAYALAAWLRGRGDKRHDEALTQGNGVRIAPKPTLPAEPLGE